MQNRHLRTIALIIGACVLVLATLLLFAGDGAGALLLLTVGLPTAAALWYFGRPLAGGPVPRDIFAVKAKAGAIGPGMFIWPTRAYRETLIDGADDASHGPVATPDCSIDANEHEFTDDPEHRAKVVADLKKPL